MTVLVHTEEQDGKGFSVPSETAVVDAGGWSDRFQSVGGTHLRRDSAVLPRVLPPAVYPSYYIGSVSLAEFRIARGKGR